MRGCLFGLRRRASPPAPASMIHPNPCADTRQREALPLCDALPRTVPPPLPRLRVLHHAPGGTTRASLDGWLAAALDDATPRSGGARQRHVGVRCPVSQTSAGCLLSTCSGCTSCRGPCASGSNHPP